MTPEEIYVIHHRTLTRPDPFAPNDTIRAMEEYAAQEVKKAVQDTKAEYGVDIISQVDEIIQIKKDIEVANRHLGNVLLGPALSYFADHRAASNFYTYINKKYCGGTSARKLTDSELRKMKGGREKYL